MARETRLADYDRKRSFDRTPKPRGSRRSRRRGDRFVVQEHHARRLHWDLRLERDGVLVSWALPRGFPDDPERNRLAVHTEDHPLEYLTFEGDIPSGEYGAGAMTVWDAGTYEAEKFTDGEVVVHLHGQRVEGRYSIFQTHGKDWLIHRMDPPDPGVTPVPEGLVPMEASLSELPADDERWAFEIKWDGVRALAYCEPGHLRFFGRDSRDLTAQYPELKALEREIGSRRAVLDGEIVALDEQGRPSLRRLQARIDAPSKEEVRRRQREVPVTYVIFDLLHLEGRSLLDSPYERRRQELRALNLAGPHWQTPGHQHGDGAALLSASKDQHLEGIVAKRLDSTYQPGRRTDEWLKIMNVPRQEVVVGGWLPAEETADGSPGGGVRALLVGVYQHRGNTDPALRFVGKVSTGLDSANRRRLTGLLRPLSAKTSPFTVGRVPRDAAFVEPALVCVVNFTEWTKAGTLRDPSYLGLRTDKPATGVVREEPIPPPRTVRPRRASQGGAHPTRHRRDNRGSENAARSKNTARSENAASSENTGRVQAVRGGRSLRDGPIKVGGREVKLTNLDKVLYPCTGTTKGQVVEYYRAAASGLLPHLKGRPVTMKRYPDGVEGPHFYEKQCPPWRPDWVRTAAVWSDQKQRDIDYCLIDDRPSLLWAANLADLEIHALLARVEDLQRPTMMVFDLDPGEGVGLRECARIAVRLRDVLDDLGLKTFVKSSGSKGLHAHVPLNTAVTYDDTKPFAHALARLIERDEQELAVSVMTRSRRAGKVLIDWSQNTPHKSTVMPFSLRARSEPTVATPLRWEEVEAVASGDSQPETLLFAPEQVVDELRERAALMRPLLKLRQRLPSFDGNT